LSTWGSPAPKRRRGRERPRGWQTLVCFGSDGDAAPYLPECPLLKIRAVKLPVRYTAPFRSSRLAPGCRIRLRNRFVERPVWYCKAVPISPTSDGDEFVEHPFRFNRMQSFVKVVLYQMQYRRRGFIRLLARSTKSVRLRTRQSAPLVEPDCRSQGR
jgi:hypothetical protein